MLLGPTLPALAQKAKPITASDSWDMPIKFTAGELRDIYQLNQAFLKLTPAMGQRRGAKARVKPGFLEKLEEVKGKVTLTSEQEQQAQEIAKAAAQKFKDALATSGAGAKNRTGREQRSTRPGGQVLGLLPYMEQSSLIANQETYASYKLSDVIISSYS